MPANPVRNRSVIEIMVIIFTGIIGFIIVGLSLIVAWIEVKTDGEADTQTVTTTLMSLSSAMLGALLGLIAGKSSGQDDTFHRRPDGSHDNIESQ